jgi:hypothetical protein
MAVNWNPPQAELPEPVRAKLEAFERLRGEFAASFGYVEDMHGQRRLSSISVADVVRYLHALWVCERKDRLLSVPKTIERYEGPRALELLRDWQQGDAASAVAFLQRKLDSLPFADLTRQIQDALAANQTVLAERLTHGRAVLLNRAINLDSVLVALFALAPDNLTAQVRVAAAALGHTPDQIESQLAALKTPLYAYTLHPVLARQNMQVMNEVGIQVTDAAGDRPGERTLRVTAPRMPLPPYAEEVIQGEHKLVSMADNNPGRLDESMPPLAADAPEAVEPQNTLTGPQWTGEDTAQ